MGINFDSHFADALDELKEMEADGLIALTPEKITVTDPGRVFLRNIAMPFDAYLKQATDNKPRFSKTL